MHTECGCVDNAYTYVTTILTSTVKTYSQILCARMFEYLDNTLFEYVNPAMYCVRTWLQCRSSSRPYKFAIINLQYSFFARTCARAILASSLSKFGFPLGNTCFFSICFSYNALCTAIIRSSSQPYLTKCIILICAHLCTNNFRKESSAICFVRLDSKTSDGCIVH